MPHRTRTHHIHHDIVGTAAHAEARTPLEQALIESSEMKLLLFKTFATLSTYASGFADGGAQARRTLDMLHHRMSVGSAHDHAHDDDEPVENAKPKERQAS